MELGGGAPPSSHEDAASSSSLISSFGGFYKGAIRWAWLMERELHHQRRASPERLGRVHSANPLVIPGSVCQSVSILKLSGGPRIPVTSVAKHTHHLGDYKLVRGFVTGTRTKKKYLFFMIPCGQTVNTGFVAKSSVAKSQISLCSMKAA